MGKRLKTLLLDILALPSRFYNKKGAALWHLNFVCPKCPKWRRQLCDLDGSKKCWWKENWEKMNFEIPRSFGVKNWLTRCLFLKADLSKFKKKFLS